MTICIKLYPASEFSGGVLPDGGGGLSAPVNEEFDCGANVEGCSLVEFPSAGLTGAELFMNPSLARKGAKPFLNVASAIASKKSIWISSGRLAAIASSSISPD